MKRWRQTRNLLTSKKILWAAILSVIILGTAVTLLIKPNKSPATPNKTITAADGSKVNLTPASPSEKQSNDANKQAIVNRNQELNQDNTNPANNKVNSPTLIITEASSSGVKAYVSGIFEDNGTCSATATQGSQTATAISTGFKNVSYTQCAPLNWPSALHSGAWNIQVTYKSAATQATASKNISL